MGIAAAIGVAAASGPLAAWDCEGNDVAERVSQLDAAWARLDHDAITADIMRRATQAGKPDWVGRKAWRIIFQGKAYGFGVGSSRGNRDPEKMIAGAESSARSRLAKMMGRESVGAAVVDWYRDDDGALHTLAAVEFALDSNVTALSDRREAPPLEAVPPAPAAVPAPERAPVSFPARVRAETVRAVEPVRSREFAAAREALDAARRSLGEKDPALVGHFERMGSVALRDLDFDAARDAYIDGARLARELGVKGEARARLYAGLGFAMAEKGRSSYAVKFLTLALTSGPPEADRRSIEEKLETLRRTVPQP